jgi:hypothetical protein
MPYQPKPKRKSRKETKNCIQCGIEFVSYMSSKKRYCTYACYIASGGAFRAGIASSRAVKMYGPKKDANHNEIFTELAKHCPAYDLSAHGYGLPDGIAWILEEWHLFEVKNPKTSYGRKGLNKVQKKWLSQWKGGPVYMIYTVQEAERFGTGKFKGIKVFYPGDDKGLPQRTGASGDADSAPRPST